MGAWSGGLLSLTLIPAPDNPLCATNQVSCSIIPMSSDYRLSPHLGARLVGLLLFVAAILVFAATAAVALLDLHTVVLLVVALLLVGGVLVAGQVLMRRTIVVHLDDTGYRIQLIRGAGVKEATWKEVEDAVTSSPRDIPCVVLRLKDGRTTTIPVEAVAADREDFVRDLQEHLQRGQGLRPLDGA